MVAPRAEQGEMPVMDRVPIGALERVQQFARGLLVVASIAYFWSAACVLAWVVVPWVSYRQRDPLLARRRMQRIVQARWVSFHRNLERLGIYRIQYEGETIPDGPAVLVANHPTLLDVTSIMCRNPHVCCVVKSSIIESRLVGRLLKSCGHVSGGDGNLMSGASVIHALEGRIAEGFPVLVFPEGTRSPKGAVRRFRRGAFEVARTTGAPLIPLFLSCDPPALGKGTPVWQHPLICPTLTVRTEGAMDMTDRDPQATCKQVETEFRRRMEKSAHD
jgi:1-acyl-sn-glycerol-3-phosphate acyltransferase